MAYVETNGKILWTRIATSIFAAVLCPFIQSYAEEPASPPDSSWWKGAHATGDWGERRANWEAKGIVLGFQYTGETRSNLAGGLSTNEATRYLGDSSVSVDFFTDKYGFYQGGEFYIRLENVHGEGISARDVGDVQLISSIDAPEFTQISELFYRHSLLSDKLFFKFGKQDGTGDFIAQKYAADFQNSSFGCDPTVPIPRFPYDGLGFVIGGKPTKWCSIDAGVYDGRAKVDTSPFNTAFHDGFHPFGIVEFSLLPIFNKSYSGTYRVGIWDKSDTTTEVSNRLIAVKKLKKFNSNSGFYGSFDQLIFKEKKDEKDDQGLGMFTQFGCTPSDRNDIAKYLGVGLFYKGCD